MFTALGFALAIVFASPMVDAQILKSGQCLEELPVVQDFKLEDYMGDWYETERLEHSYQFGDCSRAHYALAEGRVDVRNTLVSEAKLYQVLGNAVPAYDDGSARFIVNFPDDGVPNDEANYNVLATDYDSYAFVYNCKNYDDTSRTVSAWKLSRAPVASEEGSAIIGAILEDETLDLGLTQADFGITDQSEETCTYDSEGDYGSVDLISKILHH